MTDRKDRIESWFELFEDAKEFYDDNEGRIKDVMGKKGVVSLRDTQPLTQADKLEDEVYIVAETRQDNVGGIGFLYNEKQNMMTLDMGDDQVQVLLPSDVLVNETEAEINNGVLSVTVPRDVPEEIDVEVEE